MLSKVEVLLKIIKSKPTFLNAAVLASGGTLTAIVTFISAPIISRLFDPLAYGQFAYVNAIAINITAVSSFGYVNAIMIPESRDTYLRLVNACLVLLIGSVTLTVLILLLVRLGLGENLSSKYLLFIPTLVLLAGLINILNFITIRNDEFKRSAFSKTSSVLVSKISNIAYGTFFGSSAYGLLIGETLLKAFNVTFLLGRKTSKDLKAAIFFPNMRQVRSILIQYKNYPIFNLPSSWVALFVTQLPIFFLSIHYQESDVGAFAISNSLLNVPLMVIGQSVATAFFKRGLEMQNSSPDKLGSLVLKTTKSIFFLAIIPFGVLFGFGENIVVKFLGSDWQLAGCFAEIMAINYLTSLILYPLWSVYLILKIEKYQLILSSLQTLILVGYFSIFFYLKIEEYIAGYAIINALIQIFLIFHISQKVKIDIRKFILYLLILVGLCLVMGVIVLSI